MCGKEKYLCSHPDRVCIPIHPYTPNPGIAISKYQHILLYVKMVESSSSQSTYLLQNLPQEPLSFFFFLLLRKFTSPLLLAMFFLLIAYDPRVPFLLCQVPYIMVSHFCALCMSYEQLHPD